MKQKRITHNLNRHFIFLLAVLMLSVLLDIASISLAAGGDEWAIKANMPNPTGAAATAVVDGKLYIIGGGVPNPLSFIQEYDPVKDEWKIKADMPTPRGRLSACTVNGKIYAIGGMTNFNGPGALATVEEYDPATNTWTQKADMPTARHSLSVSVVNGQIYAIGGAKGPVPGGGAVGFQTVEVYNPATNTWVKKADMPTPRYSHDAGVVRGRIYVVGGTKTHFVPLKNTTLEYDPATDTWTQKSNMPKVFADRVQATHTVSVVNNKVYAIGGCPSGGAVALSTALEYNSATDTWTRKADMPTARADPSSGVVNGKIYIFGGWSGNVFFSTVEEYTPEGWKPVVFSVSPQGKVAKTWGEIKRSNSLMSH